ncbi:MAG: LCP family protein [Chloroflexi bacterium]|nr:LCP family protein [Chloroflexota bacterium]
MVNKVALILILVAIVAITSEGAPSTEPSLARAEQFDSSDTDLILFAPTATPFSPIGDQVPSSTLEHSTEEEVTPSPTASDPWGAFPGPSRESAIAIPPPAQELSVPSSTVIFVLLGSDEAPDRAGHRTDTIILVSLDKKTNKVAVLSIPRDLYVYVPGWRVDRINVADLFGGWEMVSQTIHYNFGIKPDYWVRVNFEGFERAINVLGGIEVQVEGSLTDECGGKIYNYNPGIYEMDGFTALCYVRMRKTTSDFDRLRRQQEVMLAVFRRVLSLDGITRIPGLYGEFKDNYDGNIGIGDILPLGPIAVKIASGDAEVGRYTLGRDMVTPWIVPYSGASVLLPNREVIQELLRTIFET